MNPNDNQFYVRSLDYDRYPNFDPRPTTDLSKADALRCTYYPTRKMNWNATVNYSVSLTR